MYWKIGAIVFFSGWLLLLIAFLIHFIAESVKSNFIKMILDRISAIFLIISMLLIFGGLGILLFVNIKGDWKDVYPPYYKPWYRHWWYYY